MSAIKDAAARHIAEGLDVVPVEGGKACLVKDWTKRTFTIEDFTDATTGLGARPTNDLGIVDVDHPALAPFARIVLPPTNRIDGRPGKDPGHFFYRAPGLRRFQFKDISRAGRTDVLVETNPVHAVLPPSPSTTGEPRYWVVDGAIGTSDADEVFTACRTLAAGGLLGLSWPKGNRHYAVLAAAGFLIRHVDANTVETIISMACNIAKDEEPDDRRAAIRDTIRKAKDGGEQITGGPTLETLVGADVMQRLRTWFSKEDDSDLKSRIKNRERITREVRRELDAEERLVVEPPASLTLTERLAQPQTEIAWRIDGWMPVDTRVMLSAQFKAGKTTLVQNVIRSVVDGDRFLERCPVAPIAGQGLFESRLALLDFEMSERQLIAWFRDQHIRQTDRVIVLPMRGAASSFDIRIDEVRARWSTQLREQHVKFLIVDCLRPIMDALGLNEHTDAGVLLTALDALLKDADISEAIVVHHMGHNGERARGDSRLRDWPDVEWRLVRQDEDPASERFISAFGRDVEVEESKLAFDKDGRRLTLESGNRRDAKADDALPAVLDVLRQALEPLSKARIEKQLAISDHSRAAVRRAIGAALRDGVLVSDTSGQGGGVRFSIREQGECVDGAKEVNNAPPF